MQYLRRTTLEGKCRSSRSGKGLMRNKISHVRGVKMMGLQTRLRPPMMRGAR